MHQICQVIIKFSTIFTTNLEKVLDVQYPGMASVHDDSNILIRSSVHAQKADLGAVYEVFKAIRAINLCLPIQAVYKGKAIGLIAHKNTIPDVNEIR